ncbi:MULTISPECIES: hypothetical protein [unclassified Sphingomonas]|uniref:hypothetical protein n=1 Tax=unclassified Sphingomonas TaxID=196159 RepID=UPI000287BBFD|nr:MULTISPECIES: hypothetical protein [unclassified Sphingomonas]
MQQDGFPRVREIVDALGLRVRLYAERHPAGARIMVQRPDVAGQPQATLDLHGAEVLWGFLMSARLAVPGVLPDERIFGTWSATLRLVSEPVSRIELETDRTGPPLWIPCTLWDCLFAELCLILAHGRADPKVFPRHALQ